MVKQTGTLMITGGKLRSILLGLILIAAGITGLSLMSNIMPKDLEAIRQLVFYVRDNFRSDSKIIISSIVAIVGCLMVIPRIILTIIMFPKWLIVHFQRLFTCF